MKKQSQIFRFCCHCVRMTLIENGSCFFCNGKFILKTVKDDLLIRKKQSEKAHESIS